MKKIYYSLALLGLVFASCHPMNNTYKDLDGNPAPGKLTYTLQPADYKLIPIAKDSLGNVLQGLTDTSEANKDIPGILNIKFPGYANKSTASITYAIRPLKVKLADSVYADVKYELTNDDYYLLPGNKYLDFSVAQLISWLPYKFPDASNYTLKVITWIPYPATLTPPPPNSFLFANGAWMQIYMLTNAQYAAVARGTYNQFASADDSNIPAYINTLLKADLSVSAIAKKGDIKYVSYNYYNSSSKITSQRVLALTYNGTDWVIGSVVASNTSTFVKSAGSWIPDPTVYYTLSLADGIAISNDQSLSAAATSDLRTALAKYGDFESGWTTADVSLGIINDVLKVHFTSPKIGVNYKVTYLAYSGGKDVATILTFVNDGTKWSLVTN
jgi:hypothetical protein